MTIIDHKYDTLRNGITVLSERIINGEQPQYVRRQWSLFAADGNETAAAMTLHLLIKQLGEGKKTDAA